MEMNKPNSYAFVKRQINKVKGWELMYFSFANPWPKSIGFFPSMKAARQSMINHMNDIKIRDDK